MVEQGPACGTPGARAQLATMRGNDRCTAALGDSPSLDTFTIPASAHIHAGLGLHELIKISSVRTALPDRALRPSFNYLNQPYITHGPQPSSILTFRFKKSLCAPTLRCYQQRGSMTKAPEDDMRPRSRAQWTSNQEGMQIQWISVK